MAYPDLDARLIEALRDDARRSLSEVARVLGVSTGTVRNHLTDLEKRGVITGYRPVVDYGKLGFGLVAVIRIKARGEALPRIVEALVADDRLTHVYEITGEFDVMVIGRFRSEIEMNQEIKRLLGVPGIEGTNTSIVLSASKEAGDVSLAEDARDAG